MMLFLALPILAGAQDAPHPVYLGIDAAVLRARIGSSPGQTHIIEPAQSFQLGKSIGDALRLEIPLGLLVTKENGSDAITEFLAGIMLDVFPAHIADDKVGPDQSGFFVGGGPIMEYLHASEFTRKQFGVTGRAGYEFALDNLHLRVAGLYERRFRNDDAPESQQYGGSVGVSFPVIGEGSSRDVSEKLSQWYVQARAGINRRNDNESPMTTIVWLPKPFFSVFYFPGGQRTAALGIRTHVEYVSRDDFSTRYIQIAPRTEINLLRHSASRPGLQLGAHAIIDHIGASSQGSGFSSNYYGAGGDVSLTLPVMPTLFKIGIGFDVDAAGGKPHRPSGSNLRLDFAIDRFL